MKKYRSSRLKVFGSKGVLKNFPKFTRKPQYWSLFNRVTGLKDVNLLKRDYSAGVFIWASAFENHVYLNSIEQ